MKKDIEHALQCACVHWFRMQYPQYAIARDVLGFVKIIQEYLEKTQ